MKRILILTLLTLVLAAGVALSAQYRQLPVEAYLDKMKGGWAGEMIGVSFGAPVEFRAAGKIDEGELPAWTPDRVGNSIGQDDIYVELSFLEAIEKYGLDITNEQMGKSYAATEFGLWHANKQGRENCRNGIMPPDSGSPKYNPHYCDIDFQIDADIFGLINPGLPRSSNAICDKFGRMINYGDGLYGGMFVAAMYTQAFFEKDVQKIVRQGLRAIPTWSVYAQTIRDVIRWHNENPEDWRATWRRVQDKWASHPSGYCSSSSAFNIDANLNGAYVVIGLLYGDGDLAKTMEIATRCGQDSDCNPANAAGILCTALGYSGIPEEYKSGIPGISDEQFRNVKYTFDDLIPLSLKLARENVRHAGGSSKVIGGKEVFLIPVQYPVAPKLEK